MKLCWITDPHLNFLPPKPTLGFTAKPWYDAIVMTGDIAEAPSLLRLLYEYADNEPFDCPIYFVLGNHDYYRGSFEWVRQQVAEADLGSRLIWLDAADPILLDGETALVGAEGWYDGVLGDSYGSGVVMSDFKLIEDLRGASYNRGVLLGVLRERARLSVAAVRPKLLAALYLRKKVVFATHYPPFEGACWHEGKVSDKDWLPWFTCAAMGEMLSAMAANHLDSQILVLCGHTHGEGVYQHAPNLRVLTGKAAYGVPMVAGLVTSDSFAGWS